ncbi:MAG TPA: 5'-nucleotidase C-terminal domain-containing protein [Dissulfurispiraceae bacterium]|nr:5'-nucleotidase C-terminal domain-containing protein [Dissulfurispiraceae bacterium]
MKKIGGKEIGIIGLTTMETPAVYTPGPNVVFADPVVSIRKAVEALHSRGVTGIILLSHSGYDEDIALAKKVSGLSLIVGGHTHSLLGDKAAFAALGLTAEGQYPTVVKDPLGRNVLIVQSWEWAKLMGVITVTLDAAGEAVTWSGSPNLLVGTLFRRNNAPVDSASVFHAEIIRSLRDSKVVEIHEENPEAKKMLQDYARPLQEMMLTNIAVAAHDLKRGDNTGQGPLGADAMLWKTRAAGTQIAIQNTGGIRRDIAADPVSIATAYELLPFSNTLVILDLKGTELKAALEEAVDFQLAGTNKGPYIYVAGVTFRLDASKTYRIVTNNYLARGGDGIPTMGSAAGYRTDTGFTDAEVFLGYLKSHGTIYAPTEKRISSALPGTLRSLIFCTPPAEIRKAA